jgi:methionyl-tRNA synthetase
MKKKFYITTPIYYPNASPHIGSVYSTLLADIIARYKRLMGEEVVFLTGTDEHGQKVYEAAEKAQKNPQQFVDEIAQKFQSVFNQWNLSYTIFMRTTEPFHQKAVQSWITLLQEKGYIYKSFYQGWYCVSAEEFLLEKDCNEKDASGAPISPISGKPAVWLKQEAYFFKLSYFQDQLLAFFENHKEFIIPQERTEEIIRFIKDGLKDLCISRLKKDLSWGIPFPGDEEHVVYVWADALNNYITGVGYLQDEAAFNVTWPADIQIMAKDKSILLI